MTMIEEKLRLTQYSHGSGCGCKIEPAVLEKILKWQWYSERIFIVDSRL